jgi:DNA-binding transcriptional regulator YiaG
MNALPFCHLSRTARRARHSVYWRLVNRYPVCPKTVGQHLRKRRLDLGLKQSEVARTLGVHIETFKNWERGVNVPTGRVIPKILGFLGYDPVPKPTSLAGRILQHRRTSGLTQVQFARVLDVNPSTLAGWESGLHTPTKEHRNRLFSVLGYVLGKSAPKTQSNAR